MQQKVFCLYLFALLFCSCRDDAGKTAAVQVSADSQRIISFAPAITETLFALGLGERVIAVSNFCSYPPEVKDLPKAGGFLDPDLEKVVRLQPDCVVIYGNHSKVLTLLERLKIPALIACGDNFPEIFSSIDLLGRTFNRQRQARQMIDKMQTHLQELRLRLPAQHRVPTVMLVVWRERGEGTLKNITVAGNDRYYRQMIEIAGGKLLPEETGLEYPSLGIEGILQMNPEVIIEIAPELAGKPLRPAVDDWSLLPEIKAVSRRQIFLITDDYAAVPGPRSTITAEKIVNLLAPFVRAE